MGKEKSLPNYYKTTPVFDLCSLPYKLRNAHQTKAGTWGIIRVLEGNVRYVIEGTDDVLVQAPELLCLMLPQQLHHVEPTGDMRMQVEFYDRLPTPEELNP